ncbi:armadillo-type protein [Cladochytrium replicatum]|nr:armadillo-type protein [Cladochytrium replicatum]
MAQATKLLVNLENVPAVIVIQRWFRRRISRIYLERAATCVQAAYRSLKTRKELVQHLAGEIGWLRNELRIKSRQLDERRLELKEKDKAIESLQKIVHDLENDLSDKAAAARLRRPDYRAICIDCKQEYGGFQPRENDIDEKFCSPSSDSLVAVDSNGRSIWAPLAAGTTCVFTQESLHLEHSMATRLIFFHDEHTACSEDEARIATLLNHLVEKITKTNDQPASLFLQQKLSTAPSKFKDIIFEAINKQSLPLMKNRFGNFLVQRCLELGSPMQNRMIGNAMKGQFLPLACDRFACHVLQKALEFLDEDMKAGLISELFRAIPETFTHRFASHVWQRIFETEWSTEPPVIIQYVDAALKGQWHSVANDENGSLVIQCIFENCSEKEKSSILCEILANTVAISKGQWGNWVIQHILEHGLHQDKLYILNVVKRNLFPMSIDQYASKVVEKALKVAERRDLHEIVDQAISPLCGRGGRPNIIDMMNNQFGNYVVQHIVTIAEPQQREVAVRLMLPHLSTLRGSKYGQRVAVLIEKHTHHRMGPTVTLIAAKFPVAAAFSMEPEHNRSGLNP